MKFSIKDFSSKCDQIRSFLRIWSHLLKQSLMENFSVSYIKGLVSRDFYIIFFKVSSLLTMTVLTSFKQWISALNSWSSYEVVLFVLMLYIQIISPIQYNTLHKKIKFSIKDFFSKYDQIRCFSWSHFLGSDTYDTVIICCSNEIFLWMFRVFFIGRNCDLL